MNLPDPSSASPLSSLPRRDHESRRRRRRGQLNIPRDAEGRAALLASLAHRAYPTYELFVFAAFSGSILALGYLMDSQALLLFGVLVAPLLLPWVGLLLGTITGSLRFVFETLMALLLSTALVFGIGLLAGIAARAFLPRTFDQAFAHSRLWWPDLIILALGAVILTVSFVRSESRPFLPSVVLAYEFFLPLASGGFGLGSGLEGLWPHGLLVFIVHFAWAGLLGLLALLSLRLAPASASALVFTSAVGLLLLAVLVVLMSGGNWAAPFTAQPNAPAPTSSAVVNTSGDASPDSSPVPVLASATPLLAVTSTSAPPTLEPTLPPTLIPTITLTIEPTPIYAQVNAPRGGAVLRAGPGGDSLTTLDNFTYVEILPETELYSGYTWVHVIALTNGDRREGWMVQQYLETPAAGPASAPGSSPTVTPPP
ncbi:MAG: DUF389 domain-containing protein [Chloroflexota bacterium]